MISSLRKYQKSPFLCSALTSVLWHTDADNYRPLQTQTINSICDVLNLISCGDILEFQKSVTAVSKGLICWSLKSKTMPDAGASLFNLEPELNPSKNFDCLASQITTDSLENWYILLLPKQTIHKQKMQILLTLVPQKRVTNWGLSKSLSIRGDKCPIFGLFV